MRKLLLKGLLSAFVCIFYSCTTDDHFNGDISDPETGYLKQLIQKDLITGKEVQVFVAGDSKEHVSAWLSNKRIEIRQSKDMTTGDPDINDEDFVREEGAVSLTVKSSSGKAADFNIRIFVEHAPSANGRVQTIQSKLIVVRSDRNENLGGRFDWLPVASGNNSVSLNWWRRKHSGLIPKYQYVRTDIITENNPSATYETGWKFIKVFITHEYGNFAYDFWNVRRMSFY